jgi:hypothetical protein
VTRWLAAAVLAVALAVAGWFGWRAWQGRDAGAPVAVQELPQNDVGGPETVETVRVDQPAVLTAGTTPMPERVATLGLLNKRNGRARDLQLKPGQAVRVGDVVVRLRACERTAPWEPDQLTGAFAQVDIRGVDGQWRRSFSGWLFKERPALNVVQHPIYDVWTKNCAMAFPATGPDTVSLSAPASRARKSAAPAAAPASEPAPSTPDNASPNLAR